MYELWFEKTLLLKYHLISLDIRDIENRKQTNKRLCQKTKWQKRKIDLKTKTLNLTVAEVFLSQSCLVAFRYFLRSQNHDKWSQEDNIIILTQADVVVVSVHQSRERHLCTILVP